MTAPPEKLPDSTSASRLNIHKGLEQESNKIRFPVSPVSLTVIEG